MLHTLGNHRAHGVALLVVLASSLSLAEFMPSDSQNLYIIRATIEGPSDGDSIWATLLQQRVLLEDIESDLSSVSTISSDVSTIKQYLDTNLNGDGTLYSLSLNDFIKLFNQKFFHGVDRYGTAVESNPATVSVFSSNGYSPFIEPGSSFNNRRTAQMVVTNIAETYWLERIARSRYIPFDLNTFLNLNPGQGTASSMSTLFDYYNSLYNAFLNGDYSLASSLYSQIYNRFGTWRWEPWNSFFTLNPNILIGSRTTTNNFVKLLTNLRETDYGNNAYGVYWQSYYDQYSTRALREHFIQYFNNTGISVDSFNPTNFFSADGSIENSDQAFTNSETSVFNKFATSFLPSSLFNPDQVNTSLFSYVDSGISETPTFNPPPLRGGTRSSSRSDASFNYDFEDSVQYDYNLVNPLKTATDVVQRDTDIDDKFNTLAQLVNQRISSIFDSPLNSISQQPSRWSVKFRDKDGATIEEYVASQQAETTDGISFACWVLESTMFVGFFIVCVRRSLRIGNSLDPQS